MAQYLFPNSAEALSAKIESKEIPQIRIWLMLMIRSILPFGLLLLLALIFKFLGSESSISASAAYWLWFVTITNILCIILMVKFGRQEGVRLREIFYWSKSTWKEDLLWFLLGLVVSVILVQIPTMFLAGLLWGNPNFPNDMLFQAIPTLAIYPLFLLMPTTQALAELPTYWGYVCPRLQARGMNRWAVILLVGFMLSIQHMFFSFQLDWRYDLWLAVKFLPFALWTGFLIEKRPTVLPYLMGMHLLLDASLPILLLLAAQGVSLSG